MRKEFNVQSSCGIVVIINPPCAVEQNVRALWWIMVIQSKGGSNSLRKPNLGIFVIPITQLGNCASTSDRLGMIFDQMINEVFVFVCLEVRCKSYHWICGRARKQDVNDHFILISGDAYCWFWITWQPPYLRRTCIWRFTVCPNINNIWEANVS